MSFRQATPFLRRTFGSCRSTAFKPRSFHNTSSVKDSSKNSWDDLSAEEMCEKIGTLFVIAGGLISVLLPFGLYCSLKSNINENHEKMKKDGKKKDEEMKRLKLQLDRCERLLTEIAFAKARYQVSSSEPAGNA
ncbi:hypothetical protein BJ508DRAFT_365322 [Ascobolus immersus RN42]|uniref:Uncharacterized protein n=1 Tax=Ascobolus immersus RN42 TaxID=1160509 RepID=A0A3N4HVB2_ASCIM|nr:hypothetical protein BJ508DRAFT_365322 [Ascobolus immersus RN42]